MMAGPQVTAARHGFARLGVRQVSGKSALVEASSSAPVKLLAPQPRGASVWAYLSSYGGGLLAGDSANIQIDVEERAHAFLTSQSSTKIYTSPTGVPARQDLKAVINDNAFLAVVPDPVQCFAASVYEQRQVFHMAASGGLVFVDALSAGRTARAERWAFSRFFSRTEVFVDEKRACLDALLLGAEQLHPSAMGRFNSFATMLMFGGLLSEHIQQGLKESAEVPVRRQARLVMSASPLRHGVILRFASEQLELLTAEIHRRLAFLPQFLGDDPLARKW